MKLSSPSDIKDSFPIFKGSLKDWAYVDNAATTQIPNSVIDAVTSFYRNENANVHRGLYDLSTRATLQYEESRKKVAVFIGAKENEIAFTSGTTGSINVVANSLVDYLDKGDEILISAMEHHSNLIPWQRICDQTEAKLKVVPVEMTGDLSMSRLNELISTKTKLVAITQISNTLGTVNPVEEIINVAHKKNALVLIDAAQSAGHFPLNVEQLEADFLAFSGHKMFGPMGTGVLYVKEKNHEMIAPLEFGGGAIKSVSFDETKLRDFPFCVEAGTPNVAGVIGLGTAVDFLHGIDTKAIGDRVNNLTGSLKSKLKSLPFVKLMGEPANFSSMISFVVEDIHPHDVASFLADKKIAVRAGHHCTQPLHDAFGIPASVRVSFSVYNTEEDVNRVHDALVELKRFWS